VSPLDATPDQLIQAAALTPSFRGAYQSAPASIQVGEVTYERDAARTDPERLWYLAAVAMQNPRAIYLVGNQGSAEMAEAYDQSEVDSDSRVISAKQAKTSADGALDAIKVALKAAQQMSNAAHSAAEAARRQFADAQQQVATLEQRSRSVFDMKDIGQVLSNIGTGFIKPGAEAIDVQIRLGNARNFLDGAKNQLTLTENDEATKKSDLEQAQKDLSSAQKDAKSAQKSLDQAIATVQKELRAKEDKAAAEASAQAARDAAERQQQAQQQWEQQQQNNAGSGGIYGDYIEPEWQSGDWATTDPNAELGDTEYLDEQSDLYGDEDEARKMAALTGEPIIGVNTVVSPYALDRYYAGYDLEQNPVFGVDSAALVGGIIAGVLAMAPAIIGAVAPPPAKDADGSKTNVGVSGKLGGKDDADVKPSPSSSTFNVDTLLEKIGLKKTINDAATAAGGSAGQQGGASVESTVTKYLGTGLIVAGIIWLVRR
jgi:hypothetical protein